MSCLFGYKFTFEIKNNAYLDALETKIPYTTNTISQKI